MPQTNNSQWPKRNMKVCMGKIEFETQMKGKLREAKTIETKRNRLTEEKCEFKVTTRYCKIQYKNRTIFCPAIIPERLFSQPVNRSLVLPFLAMFFHKERACSQATVFQTQMKIRYFLSIYLSFSSVDHSTVKLLMAVFCLFCLNCLRARSSNVKNPTDNPVNNALFSLTLCAVMLY